MVVKLAHHFIFMLRLADEALALFVPSQKICEHIVFVVCYKFYRAVIEEEERRKQSMTGQPYIPFSC